MSALNVASYRRLGAILAVLLAFTMVTVWVSRHNLGPFNVVAALGIAAAKASLVLIYFMHLGQGEPLVKRGFLVTIVVLTIMIGFVFLDTSFRGGLYVR